MNLITFTYGTAQLQAYTITSIGTYLLDSFDAQADKGDRDAAGGDGAGPDWTRTARG